MGYEVLNSVEMTAGLHRAAAQLATKLPFDIMVTSGVRTPREQAAAMFQIKESGGSLTEVYRDDEFALTIDSLYPDLDAATEVVKEYFSRGGGSAHGRSLGLDIRTTGGGAGAKHRLDSDQIKLLIEAADSLGFEPLREYAPPHLHLTISEKKSNLLMGLVLIGGLFWILK